MKRMPKSRLALMLVLAVHIFMTLPSIQEQSFLFAWIRFGFLYVSKYLALAFAFADIVIWVFNKPRSRSRTPARLGIGMIAGSIGLLLLIFFLEMWTQAALLPDVERRIGAAIVAPIVYLPSGRREMITVARLKEGGALRVAGAREGDIVVEDGQIGDLCLRFLLPTGNTASLAVVDRESHLPLRERKVRVLQVELR